MSLAVKIGLSAECGVVAVAGVTLLWCDLCEIERRGREGSWAVTGVSDRTVTEGFTTEQLHLDVTQTPGGGQETLPGGHLSLPSVILWRSQRHCYITSNIKGYARIRPRDINPINVRLDRHGVSGMKVSVGHDSCSFAPASEKPHDISPKKRFDVEVNFGELWRVNLHRWPIASHLDSADLWGDGYLERKLSYLISCVAPFTFMNCSRPATISRLID